MDYRYKILDMNKAERWITITSNDSFDLEDPDSFICFIKMIQRDVNGIIRNVGVVQYQIEGDGIRLLYQWDGLFGITVIYPPDIPEERAVAFLSSYMSEF